MANGKPPSEDYPQFKVVLPPDSPLARQAAKEELFTGRLLLVLGGGFLVGPISPVLTAIMRPDPTNWALVLAVIAGCWIVGGGLLRAGATWPKWRPTNQLLAARLGAVASSLWAWAAVILLIAFGPAISVAYFMRQPVTSAPILTADIPSGFNTTKSFDPQIGDTFSLQLAQLLRSLPQPCLLKITNPSNSEIGQVINWVTTYGNIPAGVICYVQPNDALPSADSPVKLNSNSGIVVHWASDYDPGEKVAHFLYSSNLKVSTSHQQTADSPKNLIWIDIGPGDPWRN